MCRGDGEFVNLDCNELYAFMVDFEIDILNRFGELIVDEPTNTSLSINSCESIDDVKVCVLFALCRPIGKGLSDRDSDRVRSKVNRYFGTELTQEDFVVIYEELCSETKLEEFKSFMDRGLPMSELMELRYT